MRLGPKFSVSGRAIALVSGQSIFGLIWGILFFFCTQPKQGGEESPMPFIFCPPSLGTK